MAETCTWAYRTTQSHSMAAGFTALAVAMTNCYTNAGFFWSWFFYSGLTLSCGFLFFFSFGLCCFCLLVFLGRIGSAEVCLGSHQPWRQGSLIYVVPNVFFFSSHILITDLQKHAVVALNVMGVNTPIKKTYTIFNQLKTLQVLASSAHSNALREKQKDSGETKVGVLVLHL